MNLAYNKVTEKIIEAIKNGTCPWQRGWLRNPARSHNDGREYSFLNQILLNCEGGEWLTFNQVSNLGGKVKKGEHGSVVLFYGFKEETLKDENGNEILDEKGNPRKKRTPIPRYYYVFEVGQCEGIERKYAPELKAHDPVKEAEEMISNYLSLNPELRITERVCNKAYYSPSDDAIVVPEKGQFDDVRNFYSTLFHEMVHSTMKKNRCDRKDSKGAFGSEKYSKEELVAEIGAVFLCDYVGIEGVFDNSAAYLQGWLKALENDATLIVSAASKAEKAVNFILRKGEEGGPDEGGNEV